MYFNMIFASDIIANDVDQKNCSLSTQMTPDRVGVIPVECICSVMKHSPASVAACACAESDYCGAIDPPKRKKKEFSPGLNCGLPLLYISFISYWCTLGHKTLSLASVAA